jgi:hypothetical protein
MQKNRKFLVPFAAPRSVDGQAPVQGVKAGPPQDQQPAAEAEPSRAIEVPDGKGVEQKKGTADPKASKFASFKAPAAASSGIGANGFRQPGKANAPAKGPAPMQRVHANSAATSEQLVVSAGMDQQVWSCLYIKAGRRYIPLNLHPWG